MEGERKDDWKSKIRCHRCKQLGHLKWECKSSQKGTAKSLDPGTKGGPKAAWKGIKQKGKDTRSVKFDHRTTADTLDYDSDDEEADGKNHGAFTAATSKKTFFWSNGKGGDLLTFIADSGATCHMVHDARYVSNIRYLDKDITVGGGRTLASIGTGNLEVLAKDTKGKTWPITVHDVLVVPDLGANLLSVAKLKQKGADISFDLEKPYISLGPRKTGLILRDGLYRWVVKPKYGDGDMPEAYLSVCSDLTHERHRDIDPLVVAQERRTPVVREALEKSPELDPVVVPKEVIETLGGCSTMLVNVCAAEAMSATIEGLKRDPKSLDEEKAIPLIPSRKVSQVDQGRGQQPGGADADDHESCGAVEVVQVEPKSYDGVVTRSIDVDKWHRSRRSGDRGGTSQRVKQKSKNTAEKHRDKVGPPRRMLCRRGRVMSMRRARAKQRHPRAVPAARKPMVMERIFDPGRDILALPAAMMSEDSKSFKEALRFEQAEDWMGAMSREYNSLLQSKTESRWVFTTKQNGSRVPVRHKARFIAKGYSQQFGSDNVLETFIPVTRLTSIKCDLSLAAMLDWEYEDVDVDTACRNVPVPEAIFVEQSEGICDIGTGQTSSRINY